MPGNNTGLWLIDALFSPRYVRRTVRVFQDFRSLLGQPIWNPARDLLNTAGEIKCDNPARAVLEAAGIDVQAVLTDPDHFNSTDEATHTSLVAAMRKALGAGERYFTEEDILVSILQPDKPAVGTAKLSKDALLAVLGEKAAIDGMRKLLGASLAGCATDEDLLAGLSDPGGQLTLSGACRIQTWRVDQRQMAESFQFTYDQLSIDLWSSRWSKDFEPRKPMQFKARKPETQAPAPTEVENATSVVPVG